MPRPNGRSASRSDQQPPSRTPKRSQPPTADPYALIGLVTALAQVDTAEDIARFTAKSVISALGVSLSAVALLGEEKAGERVIGQLSDAPLGTSLAQELQGFLLPTLERTQPVPSEPTAEIDVQEEALPNAASAGVRRFLSVRLYAGAERFGALLAGNGTGEEFLPGATSSPGDLGESSVHGAAPGPVEPAVAAADQRRIFPQHGSRDRQYNHASPRALRPCP